LRPVARVLFVSGYTQGLLGAQGVLEARSPPHRETIH
jgi:hypothetical protein